MVEQAPRQPPKASWYESPHLSFGQKPLPIEGDPETETGFKRAFGYLETITAHFLEFGPLEEKTPFDVAYELSHHNAWHQWEVEQERKSGEKLAEYQEINLYQLRALSKRRLLAIAELGLKDTNYPAVEFIDTLIEQAVVDEEAFNRSMTSV